MRDVVIVAGVRTPFGRAIKGSLKDTRPDTMGQLVIEEAVKRSGIEKGEVGDVVLGCAMPEAEQGMNVARVAALAAGLPEDVPGMTVNRFCSSGVQSIALVADRIAVGAYDVGIAGGVETMSMIPMGGNKPTMNPQFVETIPNVYMPMGVTAENVARRFGVSRKDQDEFAFRSHQRAVAAQQSGKLDAEILPVHTSIYDAEGKLSQINTSYAIAAWMIGQTKLVIPSVSLLNQDLTRKTASLFHCSPGYSKMTFTNYHPVTHSFSTSAKRLV